MSETQVLAKLHRVVPYTVVYSNVRYVPALGYSDPSSFFEVAGALSTTTGVRFRGTRGGTQLSATHAQHHATPQDPELWSEGHAE
jgi:hypothetical protein